MADIIKVSTDQLRDTAEKYVNCKNQMQTAYLQMSNAVRVVDSSWNGDASEAFKAQFDEMYKNLEQTEQKVQDAIDEATQVAEIIEEVEAGLVNTIDTLDTGTSPFD